MAKAQAIKPKSSGFFGLFGGSKAKAATRPASAQSTTMTNLQAVGASATRGSKSAGSKAPASAAGRSMAQFRLPFIGARPLTFQLQVLGILALVLLVGTAFM